MHAELAPWQLPVLLLTAFALIGFKMWRAASVVRAQGREVRPKLPPGALFAESGASGRSEGSLKTRIGGANRILLVWVSRQEFGVECAFPFNLLMQGDPYDLHHRVPIHSVTAIRRGKRREVFVTFDDAGRRSHTLRLIVKDADRLVSVFRSLGTRVEAPHDDQ